MAFVSDCNSGRLKRPFYLRILNISNLGNIGSHAYFFYICEEYKKFIKT